MIADTSFILDVLNGDEGALRTVESIESTRTQEKVAAITVCELYEGVIRSSRPEAERESVLSVLDSKAVVPATETIMRRAGKIRGELYNSGTVIDREDCIIAATALDIDERVVTRNVDHFERVDGVDVRSY